MGLIENMEIRLDSLDFVDGEGEEINIHFVAKDRGKGQVNMNGHIVCNFESYEKHKDDDTLDQLVRQKIAERLESDDEGESEE